MVWCQLLIVSFCVLIGLRSIQRFSHTDQGSVTFLKVNAKQNIDPIIENQPLEDKEGKRCPVWYSYNNISEKCECGSDIDGAVLCDQQRKRVSILDCHCMTYDNQVGVVVASCFTNCEVRRSNTTFGSYNNMLPSTIAHLNEAMCGERWNRDGRLCSKCRNDYYLPVYSYQFDCIKCSDSDMKHNWIKYVAVAFVPLTVFYLVTLIIRINVAHPSVDILLLYTQLLATPANIRVILTSAAPYPNISPLIHFVATLYGVWNLDFFRTILPPICLKVDTLQALSLDYLIAFYPLILIVITYILIELHDRDCILIVILWKPFSKCFSSFRSKLNTNSSVINAFSTYLLLSYVKLNSVTSDLLAPVWAYDLRGNSVGVFLFNDADIQYFGRKHLPYAILALFVLTAFILLPILFCILYPLKCCMCFKRWPSLQICLDTFQGYYKDGTDKTRDCRWFPSVYLFGRIFFLILAYFVPNVCFYLIAAFVCSAMTALILLLKPYKPKFSKYNTINALISLSMVVMFIAVVSIDLSSLESFHTRKLSIVITAFASFLPIFYLISLFVHWIYSLCYKCLISSVKDYSHHA